MNKAIAACSCDYIIQIDGYIIVELALIPPEDEKDGRTGYNRL